MANRPAPVTQAEVTRAIKGARKAGFDVARVEVKPDGTVIMFPASGKPGDDDRNDWD